MDKEKLEEEGRQCCPHCDFDYFNCVNKRNSHLKRLIEIEAPQVIVDSEKRMLRESVDMLLSYLDNDVKRNKF